MSRFRTVLAACAIQSWMAAAAGAWQAATPESTPSQLIARAESLQDKDDVAALAIVRKALVHPRIEPPERARGIALRCWLTVSVAIDDVPALATSDLGEAERMGDAKAISELRACRGYAREQANDLANAAQDYEVALAMGRRAEDSAAIAQASVLRGELRYLIGDTANALTDLQFAYRLQKQRGNQTRARYALNAIANLYADEHVGEYDKAIDYYRQLLAAHQANRDIGEESTTWFNIASTLDHKGDLKGALVAYGKSLEIELRRGDQDEIASVRRALGVALVKLGRMDEAMPLFDQAVAQFRGTNDDEGVAAARLSRAVALRKLGRLPAANEDLAAARDYFTRHANPRFLEKIESERALAYAAAYDWQRAYAASVAQIAHRDELAARLKQETTTRMRVAFDTEKTENENRTLEQINAQSAQSLEASRRIESLQRIAILLGIGISLLLVWMIARAMRTSRRMRALALTDELTRLPNRRHVFEIADRASGAAHETSAPWCVLALDIDHFKSINDRFGHDAGDKVLVCVAKACGAAVREHDVVGRIGGEEFLVVLPRTRLAEACEVGERIRQAVEALAHNDIQPGLRVTISIGAAQSQPGDKGVGSLAKRADDCLYAAKTSGRNRVVSAIPAGGASPQV